MAQGLWCRWTERLLRSPPKSSKNRHRRRKMKLKFDSNLPHQKAAWEAVVALFAGQESCYTPLTMAAPEAWGTEGQGRLGLGANEKGTANRLVLGRDELLKNLQQVQLKNGLKQTSGPLDMGALDYTVEMETGTGKTYVYL